MFGGVICGVLRGVLRGVCPVVFALRIRLVSLLCEFVCGGCFVDLVCDFFLRWCFANSLVSLLCESVL